MKTIYIFGHKNPDTDSICSSIALSYLKNALGVKCDAKVIGQINRGTKYALDYFKVQTPSYLNDVRVQIKDVKYTKKAYISEDESIENAFLFMQKNALTAIPLVNKKQKITGYVSLKDIAKYLMTSDNLFVKTSLEHFCNSTKSKIICNVKSMITGHIKAPALPLDDFIKRNEDISEDILIAGGSYEAIEYALKKNCKVIIVTRSRIVPNKLIEKAKKCGATILSSEYSTFDLWNKIAISNYIKNINTTTDPTTVNVHDYLDDFKTLARKHDFTNYPVVNEKNECVGVLKLTDITEFERKRVILVDHNNYEQSIDGLEEAEILEIFDHHNLGNIGTNIPISFTCKPVGCTATIIYDEYKKNNIKVPKDMAGLLLSAIISDTLLFTSPTTTAIDISNANELAKIAKVNLQEYGMDLLRESSSIKGLSVDELIGQDFKSYSIADKNYGIAVITTMDFEEIEKDIDKYVNKINEMSKLTYEGVLIFITDIIKEGSYVLYNDSSEDLIKSAFNLKNIFEGVFIKDLISRKKQIIPAIMKELD